MNKPDQNTWPRDSMVFYRSMYDAMKYLPAKQFKETFTMFIEYSLDGIIPEITKQNAVPYSIFSGQKYAIDSSINRHNKCKANGSKGGNPLLKKGMKSQLSPSGESDKLVNQDATLGYPNGNQEDNHSENQSAQQAANQSENPNENVYVYEDKEESPSLSETEKGGETAAEEFDVGMKKRYAHLMSMTEPLTLPQYKDLVERFGHQQVIDVLIAINNSKGIEDRYISAYDTCIDWCNARTKKGK